MSTHAPSGLRVQNQFGTAEVGTAIVEKPLQKEVEQSSLEPSEQLRDGTDRHATNAFFAQIQQQILFGGEV